ncbi:uncharacterized protein LOC118646806 [Monomorium pharaonis]|uniref:uncharacterized protein LOC118646804 n=1 Tax=Monomorium pharaonis TaxID=307658 RepID=UPI0017477C7D|nr:uncharacterized protein LOC118646804 [Monomorium pharaonis]XP_036146394.1 uncharacterized protein LOC118646806 [Monomorium pharaonis]
MSEILSNQLVLQHSIQRALDNFKRLGKGNLTAAKIRSRIATLKDNWRPYRENHGILLQAIPASTQASTEYFVKGHFDKTEEAYNLALEYMTECLEELEPVVSHNQSIESTHMTASSDASALSILSLPTIRLPPFDGNYAEWETFRDRFTSLIIHNKDITDFARMHYLSSSLKGSALECISKIKITANNFNTAWKTLTARFESKRRTLSSLLSTLLGLPTLTRESASDLQSQCDKVNLALASLEKLDRSASDLWDDMLVHLMSNRLDPVTRKAWTLHTSGVDAPPTYEALNQFLTYRIRALEECSLSSATKSSKPAASSRVHVATASDGATSACPLCKARHYLNACPDFISKNVNQRREMVKRFKRCFNCLSSRHAAPDCNSKYSCRSCAQRHHSMLHSDADSSSDSNAVAARKAQPSTSSAAAGEVHSMLASTTSSLKSQILLATAWVRIRTVSGRSVTVRALVDQGSEATFISENLAQLLRAKRIRMSVAISAVGGIDVGTVRHATSILISPRDSDSPSLSTTALILSSLTSYAPKRMSDLAAIRHLSGIKWADADPTSSDPINVIIGADVYGDLIQEGIRRGERGQPVAQNSILGWIVSGPLAPDSHSPRETTNSSNVSLSSFHVAAHHCSPSPSLDEELRRFWEIEELPQSHTLTPQDNQCESHFRATHSRCSDGRYIVRLPFRQGPPIDIGRSRPSAERLYHSLSRRLRSQPALRREYEEFMRAYEELGHMRRASAPEGSPDQRVYIPHHPVFRADSATTHLRVVFNASSRTSNGSSLNEFLLAGPKLQTDLPIVILQWRHFKYVYSADIAKMYRQILVDPRDVDYQRVLWNDDLAEPLDYQLLTVTYGMKCAPFLALRVIKCLVDDEGHRFPLAAPILRDQIYIDDVLFGGDDLTHLRTVRDQLVSLLRCGRFELRKWSSNSPALLADIDPEDHGLACDKQIAIDDRVKILGIVWNPSRDVFQFKVTLADPLPRSKRAILSTIAKLYDSLGWVTPVTITAKILMQQLWRLQTSWDGDIPEPLLGQWKVLYAQFSKLNDIQIPRWSGVHADIVHAELHGFADASSLAYAASVYLKVVTVSGDTTLSLLAGKSRVAPIAPLTIPRLELSAAVLLVRLMQFVRKSLADRATPCICWTDSTIVLAWVRAHPSRWKTFVANRVQDIQSRLPDAEWRYVPTLDNPADCASRGLPGNELRDHSLWWQGPPWLQFNRENWPPEPVPRSADALTEERITALLISEPADQWDLASRYSSWPKLIHVTAYIFKFITACRVRNASNHPVALTGVALSSNDCHFARTFWIKRIQAELFTDEMRLLNKGQTISRLS